MNQSNQYGASAGLGQAEFPGFRSFFLKDVNPLSGNVKRRLINAPNAKMRDIHSRMIRAIRRLRLAMPNSTAGRRGDSAVRNVYRHRKGDKSFNRYFFLADIRSAYQAVTLEEMVRVFKDVGLGVEYRSDSWSIEEYLNKHFFDPKLGGLVTGGPASPDLFNLYCDVRIDRPLRWLCRQYSIVYTRYIDDLTFSSFGPIGVRKRRALRKLIQSAGFSLSDKKAHVWDLRKGPVTINGVGVCLDGRVFLPRKTLCHVRGLIYSALQKPDSVPMSVIHGKMGLLKNLSRPKQEKNRTESKVFSMYERLCGKFQKG